MTDAKPKKARKPRPVAFVRCGGGSPACEGGMVCGQGCIGCGACVEACRFHGIALDPERGVAVVDPERCIGCGLCARKCAKGVIELVSRERPIRVRCVNSSEPKVSRGKCTVSCVACGLCARNCPVNAIRIDVNHARIDYDRCIACGMCAVTCPRGAISDAFGLFASK